MGQHIGELLKTCTLQKGLLRELNPGPLAPEARIIPLDQAADACIQGVAVTADRGGFRAAGHSQLRGLWCACVTQAGCTCVLVRFMGAHKHAPTSQPLTLIGKSRVLGIFM